MPSPNNELTPGQALALGVLQGPTELLPISSSAHTSAAAWALGWPYAEHDPELRKSFEVALHTAGTLALLIVLRVELGQAVRGLQGRSLVVLASSSAPAAIGGYAFHQQIERHLGTPTTTAAALLAGAVLMAFADGFPQDRAWSDARARDGVWLGLAQAAALVPGVSRSGATVAVARILGFRAADATRLSNLIALPVLAGAALLKLPRLPGGLDRQTARTFAAGAGGAFASTLVCGEYLARRRRAARLVPFAAYRAVVAGWMLICLRRGRLGSSAHHQGQAGSV